jgi:hypothetical protein
MQLCMKWLRCPSSGCLFACFRKMDKPELPDAHWHCPCTCEMHKHFLPGAAPIAGFMYEAFHSLGSCKFSSLLCRAGGVVLCAIALVCKPDTAQLQQGGTVLLQQAWMMLVHITAATARHPVGCSSAGKALLQQHWPAVLGWQCLIYLSWRALWLTSQTSPAQHSRPVLLRLELYTRPPCAVHVAGQYRCSKPCAAHHAGPQCLTCLAFLGMVYPG